MPTIKTKEVLDLINKAFGKLEESSSNVFSRTPSSFEALVNDIKEKTDFNIKSSTLYKNIYLRVRKLTNLYTNYSEYYLDALSIYVHNKIYRTTGLFITDTNSKSPILDEIDSQIINTDNLDPSNPEFPLGNPRFPATPTINISYKNRDIMVKNEAGNPMSGTHKDRMGLEVFLFYKKFFSTDTEEFIEENTNQQPRLSLISAGSAALAIQSYLNHASLPSLKVVIDENINPQIKKALQYASCEVYPISLNELHLDSSKIKYLTNNTNGFDLTFENPAQIKDTYYDWLSYEILNQNPDYIYLPVGSGDLYSNLLKTIEYELSLYPNKSRRLLVHRKFSDCHLIGATTNNPNASYDKLYSPFYGIIDNLEILLREKISEKKVGNLSRIIDTREHHLEEALGIANENNIETEPSGIAGLVAFLQTQDAIPKDKKVLVVNTGKLKIDRFLP